MFRKYPSLFLLISIIGGVVTADLFRLQSWIYLLLAVVFGLGVIWFRKSENRLLLIGLIFFSILFSFSLYYNLRYINVGPNHIANIADRSQTYQIFGYLSDWPRIKYDRTEFKLTVDSLRVDNQAVTTSGAVLIKLSDTTTILQRGDRLEFFARIYPAISSNKAVGFDYQRYLNHKNVFGLVYLTTLLDVRIDKTNRYSIFALVDELREYIKQCFDKTLSKNSAALAAGFLIGETRDIPVELYQAFRQSGTLHLLAVSGSNVALVVLFSLVLLRPLGLNRKRRSLVLLSIIFIFALLSYNEPSVLRASVMAGLIIGGTLLERRVDLNHIIAVAALIILMVEPSQLYDVGFQLSFVIAWSLIFVLPIVVVLFDKYKNRFWYRWLVFPLLVSLVAQVFSTGIIALYFGEVPLISPLANLIIVPLVSLAVVGEMVLLVAYTVLPALGQLVGSILELVFIGVREAVILFGHEGIPALEFAQLSVWTTLLYYLLLLMAVVALVNIKIRRVILFVGLGLVNLWLVILLINHYNHNNNLYLTTVPGGIATIVELKQSGQTDLVITSLTAKQYQIDEKILIPFLKRHEVADLSRLFCLSADFQNYDDIIRVANQFEVDSLIIWPEMEAGFKDVLAAEKRNRNLKLIVAHQSLFQNETSDNGYFIIHSGLFLRTKTQSFYYSDAFRINEGYNGAKSCHLILGNLWNLNYDELKQLAGEVPGKIFCSKIEQTVATNSTKAEELDNKLENVVDLYEYQELTVSF